MEALLFNADTGSIDRSLITSAETAKMLARAIIAMPGSVVYRAQIVDPQRADLVLWDSYSDVIAGRPA